MKGDEEENIQTLETDPLMLKSQLHLCQFMPLNFGLLICKTQIGLKHLSPKDYDNKRDNTQKNAF